MLTPNAVTVFAQALLALICAAIGLWVVNPFDFAEALPIGHYKAAYACAFYVAAAIAAVGFPRLRRNDIALLGLALAGFMEGVRVIVGGDAGPMNLAAAAAGVTAAWAPGVIEEFRRVARLHPFVSYARIQELQRRRSPAGLFQREAASGDHASPAA